MTIVLQRKRNGMTLVEILFAFAIIGTVITVAYSAALRAWRTAVSANQRTQAQYLAQDQLERIRAFRSLSISPPPGSPIVQTEMDWEAFLDTLFGGSQQIKITACDKLSPADATCIWKVEPGIENLTVFGDDATTYKVTVVPAGLYCVGGNPASPLEPDDCGSVASVDLQAQVEWDDANGVPNNRLIATTQLLAPSE